LMPLTLSVVSTKVSAAFFTVSVGNIECELTYYHASLVRN
jgi:hypothetical protein